MSLVETLDGLLNQHGWAAILTALIQIADADGSVLASELIPVLNLVADEKTDVAPDE